MITKVGRIVTYLQWHLPMKSRDHIITWFCEITWKTKIIMHPLPQCLTIKSGRVGYTVKSHGPLITWSCKVMWNIYLYYHNAMATRLGEVVTYYEKHLSLKSNNPSNTWSREVMWNHFISTTFESVASKPGGVVTYNKEFSSKKSQDLWHVVLKDQVTHQIRCISTITMTMTTELGRVVTYNEKQRSAEGRCKLKRTSIVLVMLFICWNAYKGGKEVKYLFRRTYFLDGS